jgi:hypothetical protein
MRVFPDRRDFITELYLLPPDTQKLATETVLKQAELIAEEITR